MAFVQEEEEEAKPGQTAGPEGVQTSSPSGTLTGAGGGAETPAGGPKPGGSFQGITSYLARNKPAAQRLGDQVGGLVRGKGDTARNTLQTQQGAFNDLVGSKEVRQDAGLQNQILSDPTALSKNTADAARVKSMRDAEYTGPRSFEETDFYKPVSEAYGEARRTGDLTNTTGGRMELIANVAKPGSRITKGRLTLDEALLSGDTGARETVSGARDSLGDLNSRLQAASQASQSRATDALNTTNATRDAVRGALGTSRTNWQNDLEGRLQGARTEAANRTAAAQNALKAANTKYWENSKKVDPEYAGQAEKFFGGRRAIVEGQDTFSDQTLSDLGIDRGIVNELLNKQDTRTSGYMKDFGRGITDLQERAVYGSYGNELGDLSRFMSAQSPDAQLYRENVASTGDFDRLAALNDLSGESSTYLDPTRLAEAGTYNTDLVDFDTEGLSKAWQGALGTAGSQAAKKLEVNARSGGDSFLKKHGASIATGGLVGQGGKLTDIGAAMKNPLVAAKNLIPTDQSKLLYDPAQMFTDRDMPGHQGLDYNFDGDEELT